MKIKFIPVLVFAIAFVALLTSERIGPANYGYDATGAEGTGNLAGGGAGIVGCSNGGNCHNATASLNTTVELDSAGVAVTGYHPGGVYTVKITAVNNTTHNLPKFGFQLASVLAATGGTNSAAQAGTWSATLPTGVENAPGGSANSGLNIPIIEQTTQLTALSGSGGVGTVYADSVLWTAPVAGTGAIQIYGALNAVVGNDQNGQDYYQTASPITIHEDTLSHVGINEIPSQLSSFNVYPTLMNDNVTVAFDLKDPATVSVTLISMQGQTVKTLMTESMGTGTAKRAFDINGLPGGIYFVRLQIGNASVISKVVKD